MLGVAPELLRDGEGWAVETFTRFGTHNSTHVDAPWHYNSTIGGERAQTIDELPLEWFYAPGVVLDFTAQGDGDAIDGDDVEAELAPPATRSRRCDIVLVRTGRDEFYGELDYIARGPGVTAEATRWLYERGVRVMGIDAWGWDAPLHLQAAGGAKERGEPASSGPPTRPTSPTRRSSGWPTSARCRRTGFTVACFPLRIVGAQRRAGARRGDPRRLSYRPRDGPAASSASATCGHESPLAVL